ncbi:cystathionine gamma-synthase [Gammaproteobacteria bacterium]|nr:cystathionine gamma-synthase [Gammaproteobacteria bacterium]
MTNFSKDIDICTHFAEDSSEYFGAVTPPIVQTSLFAHPEAQLFAQKLATEREHYIYSRGNNPTVRILEQKLAALEMGESCKCFGSGMGAISATLFTLLNAGDHILFINNIYGPALAYAETLKKFNISHDIIFIDETADIKTHIKDNTRIIYVESPSTHNMQVLDLKAVAKIAQAHKILSIIDNTWATPIFQKPLTLGIDIVIHSCSKYIGGHSDVIAGAVIAKHKIIDQIFEIGHQLNGAALSPFDAWLLIRGLRTLPVRMLQHQKSAKAIITFLKNHPKVAKVNHPFALDSYKEDENQQLKGVSSLMSVELKINPNHNNNHNAFEQLTSFANALKLFQIGVSWGGFESLIIIPNNNHNQLALEKSHISLNLVRLYIGLEDSDMLIEDLTCAFTVI